MPTAANLNLYWGRKSCVGWHSDDEPLFGERGEAKPIVTVSFGTQHSSNGRASPVRTAKLACAVFAIVTFLSWMANVRTSFFTVRILVWNRNGLTLRSVGSDNMPVLVPCGQGWHVVCQRVRRVRQFLFRGSWEMVVFGLFGYSLEPCACGRF